MSQVTSLHAYTLSKQPPNGPASERSVATLLEQAQEIFRSQADVIAELADRIGPSFNGALNTILQSKGHVVVTGVGKSGLIGQKISATLSSTGTASFFLHPTEALHGDLGRVAPADVVLMISNSGRTEEVMRLVPHFRRLGLPLIGLLGNPLSELWGVVDHALDVSVSREACPLNLAPTTSILATVAMADALAVSLMRARDFQPEDFTRTHPGGTLGRDLATEVRAVMRTESLPLLTPDQTLRQALPTISESRLGMGIVMEAGGGPSHARPIGIVTDGDVRRALEAEDNALELPITRLMSLDPITISPDAPVAEARDRMLSLKVKGLLVVNSEDRLLGVIDIFEF